MNSTHSMTPEGLEPSTCGLGNRRSREPSSVERGENRQIPAGSDPGAHKEPTTRSALVRVRPAGDADWTRQATVDARELHEALGARDNFRDWIARRIGSPFQEGSDFRGFLRESSGGRPAKDYALTLDMAKHLAMLERSAKGHQVREYFLACEREALAPKPAASDSLAELLADPRKMLAAISGYAERVLELQATVQQQAPAVEFVERVSGSVNDLSVGEFAKVLGTGQNRLFDWLRSRRILYRRGEANLPHQEHIDAGRFVVVERTHQRDGADFVHLQTRVTGKGQLWLQRLWDADSAALTQSGGAR